MSIRGGAFKKIVSSAVEIFIIICYNDKSIANT